MQPLRAREKPLENPELHRAVNASQVKISLQSGNDIDETNTEGKTALHIAIERKNWEVFEALLAKGANPRLIDGKGNTPLHLAAEFADEKYVEALIKAGADINAKKGHYFTPLSIAIEKGKSQSS